MLLTYILTALCFGLAGAVYGKACTDDRGFTVGRVLFICVAAAIGTMGFVSIPHGGLL